MIMKLRALYVLQGNRYLVNQIENLTIFLNEQLKPSMRVKQRFPKSSIKWVECTYAIHFQ